MGEPSRARIFLWGVLFALCMAPVLLWLNFIDHQELMYPVIGSVAAIVIAIRGRWDLRSYTWFWFTMFVVAALHLVIILRIPWKSGWVPAPITGLFCIVDLVIIFGLLTAMQKAMDRRKADTKSNEPT